METLVVKKGDTGYTITYPVTNDDGTAFDLTDKTATLKVWYPGDPETIIATGECSTGTPTEGICTYTVGATDFSSNNVRYAAEIEITASGVVINTVSFRIIVKESA